MTLKALPSLVSDFILTSTPMTSLSLRGPITVLLFFLSIKHAFHKFFALTVSCPVTRLTFSAFFLYWLYFSFYCLCGTFLPTVSCLHWSFLPVHSPSKSVSIKVLDLHICLPAWGQGVSRHTINADLTTYYRKVPIGHVWSTYFIDSSLFAPVSNPV